MKGVKKVFQKIKLLSFAKTFQNEMNYKKIDAATRFYYRNDQLAAANANGYKYISAAIIELYTLYSLAKVAYLMNLTEGSVRYRLKQWGIKTRSQGGPNRNGVL